MIIAISSTGSGLDSATDPRFGRAAGFVVIDTETGQASFTDNTVNADLPHGAGIQAAQNVAKSGAQAIVTGRVGPKAWDTLKAGGIDIYLGTKETVALTLQAFTNGELRRETAPA